MTRIFERNGTLKIISVVFAIILWIYAVSDLNPETTLSVNIRSIDIINEDNLSDREMILAGDPQKQINLRLRGLTNDIRRVNSANIKATLDLSIIDRVGSQDVELVIEGLPRDIRLDRVYTVPIIIDAIITKEVPVTIEFIGDQREGYYMHPPVFRPEHIMVSGAESLVKKVIQGVVKKDISEPMEQSLPIFLVDAEGRTIESKFVRLEQSFALVSVGIYPKKDMPVEANLVGKPADGFEVTGIEIRPQSIAVNGEQSALEKLKKLPTTLVDIQGARSDINTTVTLQKIEGIYIDPSEPSEVSIIVRIQEMTVEKDITIETINVLNLSEDLTATFEPETVILQVQGLYTLIQPLTGQSIPLSMDLAGLEPGTHALPVFAQIPIGVEVTGLPETITVTIDITEEEE